MRVLCIIMLLLSMVPATVRGAIYMKIEGVEGESSVVGREGEIDVLSWSWGSSRACDFRVRADFNSISVTKPIDKSSPKLAEACATGRVYQEGRIEVLRPGPDGGKELLFLQIKFSNVLVSSYQPGGSSADQAPSEVVSFCAEGMRITYLQRDRDGDIVDVISEGFEIVQGGTIPPMDDFPDTSVRIVDSISILGPGGGVEKVTTVTEPD
jgi:type VI secretion system secreted protein Hcp